MILLDAGLIVRIYVFAAVTYQEIYYFGSTFDACNNTIKVKDIVYWNPTRSIFLQIVQWTKSGQQRIYCNMMTLLSIFRQTLISLVLHNWRSIRVLIKTCALLDLSCYSDNEFQPMASQLSKKAALPLAQIFATCRNNISITGPRLPTSSELGMGFGETEWWLLFLES